MKLSQLKLVPNLIKNSNIRFTTRYSSSSTNSMKNIVISNDTIPLGYKVSGIHCGIKKDVAKLDLGVIVSTKDCISSGVFTQNKFCAAPVLIDKLILNKNKEGIRSVLVNSGCANAVTGNLGLENGWTTVRKVDSKLSSVDGKNDDEGGKTLILSTGVIGHHLPMPTIEKGIDRLFETLSSDPQSFINLAEAFMTTDTKPKLLSKTVELKDKSSFKILGISKGAGMIHPNMATLLSTVVTDINISPQLLDKALKYATDRSFNCISIDGDTSTNDTCLLLSNKLADNKLVEDEQDPNYLTFRNELTEIMTNLAKLIVYDAEGATKFLTLDIINSDSFQSSKMAANSIITSTLFKTAIYGEDANWGRIACAVGYSGVDINPDKVSIKFRAEEGELIDGVNELVLLQDGQPLPMDEGLALKFMQQRHLYLVVDLGMDNKGDGNNNLRMWTSDLSHEYVTINGSYRS